MELLTRLASRRAAVVTTVTGVAAFAAVQSYSHIYWLARTHGQSPLDSKLMPLGVDGLILAMTLVLMDYASRDRTGPVLATVMLWLGILATTGANVLFGIRWGWTGSFVSAWPAGAFIGSAHVLAKVARSWSAEPDAQVSEPEDSEQTADQEQLARDALAESIAAGNALSARKLHSRFGLSRPRASAIHKELTGGTATA